MTRSMLEYEYTPTLEAPHSYQYTRYRGRAFLDVYKMQRTEARRQLAGRGREFEAALLQCVSNFDEQTTKSQLIKLIRQLRDQSQVGPGIFKTLLVFVKKYEVSKKLYVRYDEKLKRASDEYDNFSVYVLFALALALAYERTCRIQFLSTLLKVNDMLCSELSRLDDALAPIVLEALRIERDAVLGVVGAKGLTL